MSNVAKKRDGEAPVAVITGASRGIGRGLAMALATDGYRCVLMARSEPDLRSTADQIAAGGGSPPLVLPIDITQTSALEGTISTIMSHFGRIDVLVNNAGLGALGTLDVPQTQFDRLLDVNLRAPFAIMQAVVPIMRTQQSGHIFNLASRSGKVGFADHGAYAASKFGLVGLSEAVYRELAETGVKVTTLCPSYVDTDMARVGQCPLPPEEMIRVEDIADTIRWLLTLSPPVCVRELVLECRRDIL